MRNITYHLHRVSESATEAKESERDGDAKQHECESVFLSNKQGNLLSFRERERERM